MRPIFGGGVRISAPRAQQVVAQLPACAFARSFQIRRSAIPNSELARGPAARVPFAQLVGGSMSKPLLLALAFATTVSGCGFSESRINPMNWWQSEPPAATLEPEAGWSQNADDNRALVSQISRVELKKVHGGVVVSAVGVPPTQGWWDAALRPVNDSDAVDGVIGFEFVVAQPLPGSPDRTRVAGEASREVTAATFVSVYKLDGVNQITVAGANGTRSLRP